MIARWCADCRDYRPSDHVHEFPPSLFDQDPSPTLDQPGKVRRDHPDTSRVAAAKAEPRTGTARGKVLQEFRWGTFTDDELQVRLRMNPNTQRPRRVELVEGGFLEDSGYRRPTRYGDPAIVWQLTDQGHRWVRGTE